MERKRIKVNVIGLSYNQSNTSAYAVVLETEETKIKIPIVISPLEANAIGIQLEGAKPIRPLTHDLFKNFATAYEISLVEVVIHKFSNGIFYAELLCIDKYNQLKIIDSRSSDAIALALRFNVPIYTYEDIAKEAGIVEPLITKEERAKIIEKLKTSFTTSLKKNEIKNLIKQDTLEVDELSAYSIKELEEMIDMVIKKEEYEKASIIQKAINLKTKNDD